MKTDKAEIERVLSIGKTILHKRPELMEMSLNDVLDELDDGTGQMLHNRWGVTAWLVIKSLRSFELTDLVHNLSQIDGGILTYEYAGYLLLTECAVNLQALILEADRCNQFNKISLYVTSNLIHQAQFHSQYIIDMLLMLENHVNKAEHYGFIYNYADHITAFNAQPVVEEILEDLSGRAQYELMKYLRWEWFNRNNAEASDVVGRMMKRSSIWSKMSAIDYLEVSLNYNKTVFQEHFPGVEEMLQKSQELWLKIIPVFTKYIFAAAAEGVFEELYYRVLGILNRIPFDSIDAKYSYLESIRLKPELPESLQSIFLTLIAQPCDKNQRLMELLSMNLYYRSRNENIEEILQIMLEAFSANKYLADYKNFFDSMDQVISRISEYAVRAAIRAIMFMLSNSVDQLFFGLGLLLRVGGLGILKKEDDSEGFLTSISDGQAIRIMKAVLYYAFDNKRICNMAFQFLEFLQGQDGSYIDFCLKEIYGNYPSTMCEVAEQYKDSKTPSQAQLAEVVIKEQTRLLEKLAQSYNIKDLQQSQERWHIYQKAHMEELHRVNKRADKHSLFASMFKKRILKYGVRNAHIVTGRKDKKHYQASPYKSFKYEIEIPALYLKDPVGFELQRRAYISEVTQDAANH